jgi:hypothetical protein
LMLLNTLKRLSAIDGLCSGLKRVQQMLRYRFHRRFFNGLLMFPSRFGDDRTRKYNFFDNIFVAATWALLPLHSFKLFVDANLMMQSVADDLSRDCDAALLRVHRTLDPGFFISSRSNTVDDGKSDFVLDANDCEGAISLHETQRNAFRTSPKVREAVSSFMSNMAANPVQCRQRLLGTLAHVAGEGFYWIPLVLRVLMAFPLTTVECERDFSWLQDLLHEKRLNMRPLLVAAYLLGKKAPQYLKMNSAELKAEMRHAKKKEKTEQELGNRKVTTFFKPVPKKVVIDLEGQRDGVQVESDPNDLSESSESESEDDDDILAAEAPSIGPGPRRSQRTRVPNHLVDAFFAQNIRRRRSGSRPVVSSSNLTEAPQPIGSMENDAINTTVAEFYSDLNLVEESSVYFDPFGPGSEAVNDDRVSSVSVESDSNRSGTDGEEDADSTSSDEMDAESTGGHSDF